MVFSRFACEEMVKEMEAAVRLTVMICDIRLNDEVNPQEHSALEYVLELQCKLKYTYSDCLEEFSTTSTTIRLLDQPPQFCEDFIQCECFYHKRMLLPCRHALVICIHIDMV